MGGRLRWQKYARQKKWMPESAWILGRGGSHYPKGGSLYQSPVMINPRNSKIGKKEVKKRGQSTREKK